MSNTQIENALAEDPFGGDLVIDTFDAMRDPADALAAASRVCACWAVPADQGETAR